MGKCNFCGEANPTMERIDFGSGHACCDDIACRCRVLAHAEQAEAEVARWAAWERAWVFGGDAEYPGRAGIVDPRSQVEDLAQENATLRATLEQAREALEAAINVCNGIPYGQSLLYDEEVSVAKAIGEIGRATDAIDAILNKEDESGPVHRCAGCGCKISGPDLCLDCAEVYT